MNTYKNIEEALEKAGREFRIRPKRTFFELFFELQSKMLERNWGKSRGETKPLGDTNEPFFNEFDPVVFAASLGMIIGALGILSIIL